MNANKDKWFALFAELGFMIVPNGFHGNSTTEWVRYFRSTKPTPERVEWLCDAQYEVVHTGIFIEYEEQAIRDHAPLLQLAYLLLRQKIHKYQLRLNYYHVSLTREPWFQYHQEKVKAATFTTFPLIDFVLMIESIIADFDIDDRGGERPIYLPDYFEYGFCFLQVINKAATVRELLPA